MSMFLPRAAQFQKFLMIGAALCLKKKVKAEAAV